MREATIFIAPDYQVKSVTMVSNGSGYDFAPTVTFTSVDAGYGATGIAKTAPSGGGGLEVIGIQITNPGKGYTSPPLISFSGGISGWGLWVVVPPIATAVLSDGIKFNLDVNKDIALLTEEGYGMPPIEYITQRGPFQHGESLRDYFLRPRVFQLLIRRNTCSRDVYWDKRLELIDILRPNRLGSACAGQGILRRITSDGRKFDINVMIESGPGFITDNASWDRFAYHEAIRLVAHDPTFYTPTQLCIGFELGETSLIFGDVDPPSTMTFPITFGYGSSIQSIVNRGTWFTYPTIRVNGPMDSVAIINNTTGKQISLGYAIPTGAYALFTLTYGRKSVQLNDGTNLIGYVSGDLATFRLDPGTNEIEIRGNNWTPLVAPSVCSDYHAAFYYYERYIGI